MFLQLDRIFEEYTNIRYRLGFILQIEVEDFCSLLFIAESQIGDGD